MSAITHTIAGSAAVAALFACRPDDVLRLFYVPDRKIEAGPYCARMARDRKPYRMVDAAELEKVAGSAHHGGIVAVAKPRKIPYLDHENPPRMRFLLILDGIGNPHNLGAILRSAAFFGAPGVVLSEHRAQALLSDAVYRTAEGGVEHINLWRTRDLADLLRAIAPLYRTVAATLDRDAMPLADMPRDRPVALVVGNEENGVRPGVLEACRRQVMIPGTGAVQSLNVAQASAVLLHTFL